MATATACYQLTDHDTIKRDALVLQYLPLVRMIAKRIHRRCPPNISLDDLVSTGVIGLLEAIDRFDPSLNIQLATFAERRIRGAMIDGMREMDWVPRETRRRARLIQAAMHAAKQRLGREPLEEEIALELNIPHEDYRNWLNGIQSLEMHALEYVGPDGEESSLLAFIADDEDQWPSNIVERSELERVLTLAIERMPKVERTVLSFYYYEELSLAEIARIMNLHLSRIGQIRVQAVLRLRSHLQRVWMTPKRTA